jgi:hypothetical protein
MRASDLFQPETAEQKEERRLRENAWAFENADPRYQAEIGTPHMKIGTYVAGLRQKNCKVYGYKDKYGAEIIAQERNIDEEGVWGEIAYAKWSGVGWSGLFDWCPDVGLWQVRCRSWHWYELIVRPKDNDRLPFVCLTGNNGKYVVRGWMLAGDAKQEKWWREDILPQRNSPAFFVPQKELRLDFWNAPELEPWWEFQTLKEGTF